MSHISHHGTRSLLIFGISDDLYMTVEGRTAANKSLRSSCSMYVTYYSDF